MNSDITPDWYYQSMGQEIGPLSTQQLIQAVVQGIVQAETNVRHGTSRWVPAASIGGLMEQAAQFRQTPDRSSLAGSSATTNPYLASSDLPVSREPIAREPIAREPIAREPLERPTQPQGGLLQAEPSKLQVLEVQSSHHSGFKVEVLAYKTLSGASEPYTAQAVFFANQVGLQLKQVRVTLENSEAIVEAGALHFMHGHLDVQNKPGGVAGLGKAMLNKFVTNESAFIPRYRGSGTIYLEPSFNHYLIYELNQEDIIADKGLFYCAEGSLDVGVSVQKSASAAFLGGEGLFQTRVRGSGICVFELPVPADEVRCIELHNETLQVDGNFALMRTGSIDFTVEKSTKSLFGTLTSGELLLQTFRGTGRVWLAPTQGIYQQLQLGGITGLSAAQRSPGTTT